MDNILFIKHFFTNKTLFYCKYVLNDNKISAISLCFGEEVNQDGLQSIHVYPFVIDWFDEYHERGSFAPYWLDAINYPNDRASIKGSSDKKAFYQVIKKQSKTIQHFSFFLPEANFKKKIKISVSVSIRMIIGKFIIPINSQ